MTSPLPETSDDWTHFFDSGEVLGRDAFRIVGDDLDPDFIFEAVLVSLLSDGRAAPDDPVPTGESRRGWWGSVVGVDAGEGWGSLLWLLESAGATVETLAAAKRYLEEALAWLVRDKFIDEVLVDVSFAGETLTAGIALVRGESRADFRFGDLWSLDGA